ncbi:MAG: glycogen synthase [Candidatus Kariarchaeaceae archaeon]
MKVLWITSEVIPFVKAGGLADVSSALPIAIKQYNHDIRILVPLYSFISKTEYGLQFVKEVRSTLGQEQIKLWLGGLPESDVPIYFIEHSVYEGMSAYGEVRGEHVNLGKRFGLLSWIGSKFATITGWEADIIHCHDWMTAPTSAFLQKDRNTSHSRFQIFLTIHNMAYQGYETSTALEDLGLETQYLGDLTDKNQMVKYLQLGIKYADQVTTVSKRYAEEILTEEFGLGLQNDLKAHPKPIIGITNGIDINTWNPETDPYIISNYDVNNLSGKLECKAALQENFGFLRDSDAFLIGLVSRVVYQKGFDLLIKALPRLIEDDTHFIILGSGDSFLEDELIKLADSWADRVSVQIEYNESLAHQIYAGVDAFLIPSRYEPCGLSQLYAMRYGTIPIVHKVGGLADTVKEDETTGTGFVFDAFDSATMIRAVQRAHHLYSFDPSKWKDLVKRVMARDLSWDKPAQEWLRLYQQSLTD